MRGPARGAECAWRSGPRRHTPWRPPGWPGPDLRCSGRWRQRLRSPWRPARWQPAAPSGGCPALRRPTCRAPGRSPGVPSSAKFARSARRPTRTDIQQWRYSSALTLPVVLDVTLEGPRRGELAELVPDHRLGDEHRDVLAAVVDGEGVTEHVGADDRPTRPGLDDVLGARFVLDIHLLLKVVVDEGALLEATRHGGSGLLSASCRNDGDGR